MIKHLHFLIATCAGILLLSVDRTDAALIVAAFDIEPSVGANLANGDPAIDTDGLQLTGKVGDWHHWTGGSPTDNGVTLGFDAGAETFNDNPDVGDDLRGDVFFIDSDTGDSTPATSITVTLSGLIPSASYDIVFYGQRSDAGSEVNPSDISLGAGSPVVLDNEFDANFAGAQASGAGTLTFTWALRSGEGFSAISGVEVAILTAPEPSTFVLVALGLVGLVARRRRRQR